ncbi:Uncharacterised protein [uncultured archaeon]|nr:Uncharacterised protein [uncultured archaeon]
MKEKLAIAALVLLLVVSAGCAGSSPGGQLGQQRTTVWGWQNLVGGAIVLMVSFVTLSYMAGSVMGDEKLKSWAKNELVQVGFSVLIFVFAVALADSLDYWLKAMSLASNDPTGRWAAYVNDGVCCTAGGNCVAGAALDRGRACHIEIATDYLQMMYGSARVEAKSLLSNYATYAFLGHLSVGVSGILKELASLNFYPFAGFRLSEEYFSVLFDLTAKTMMLIRAQQIFLDLLWYPIFPVMLSMGLVLRMLYFSRKLGGLLIALALSFYIVFPMFYVLADAIFWGFSGGWTVTPANPQGWDPATIANTFNDDKTTGTQVPMHEKGLDLSLNAKNIFEPTSDKLNVDICDSATDPEKVQMNSLFDEFKGGWKVTEGTKWYSQALSFIKGTVSVGGLGSTGAFERSGPIGTLANMMVFTIFIPFLAFMTSLASFKVLSGSLGGDVEISLLSRLI